MDKIIRFDSWEPSFENQKVIKFLDKKVKLSFNNPEKATVTFVYHTECSINGVNEIMKTKTYLSVDKKFSEVTYRTIFDNPIYKEEFTSIIANIEENKWLDEGTIYKGSKFCNNVLKTGITPGTADTWRNINVTFKKIEKRAKITKLLID